MNVHRKRPSPAMVVAGTALIVAAAGTAVAAPTAIESVLNKSEKKQIKKIATTKANQAIDQRAPGLSVASANNANTARTADTANTANTATSAGNADTVDGRHATCPGGHVAVAGLCYEPSTRPAAVWSAASDDCADENLSLSTVGQLKLARDELGNVSAAGEWTDSLHVDGADLFAVTLSSTGAVSAVDTDNTRAYRCVTPLVR